METLDAIMLADDSTTSRMMLKRLLGQRFQDLEVMEASSGDEALVMARQRLPDIALLDFNMPGLDGFETALELRKLNPSIKIVLVTADKQSATRERAETENINYIAKPITDTDRNTFCDRLFALLDGGTTG